MIDEELMQEISIHALLAESDDNLTQGVFNLFTFLSTLSLRRATNANLGRHRGDNNFYPRSPCGERPVKPFKIGENLIFLSTLSLRRATAALCQVVSSELYFYPRSPCGERRTL